GPDANARADPGLRHQRTEDRLHHGLLHLRAVPARGPGGVERADVDGHDDDAAGGDLVAVQAAAVRVGRRLAPGGAGAEHELWLMAPSTSLRGRGAGRREYGVPST